MAKLPLQRVQLFFDLGFEWRGACDLFLYETVCESLSQLEL